MCVVSMIFDHYDDKWKDLRPYTIPQITPIVNPSSFQPIQFPISKEEFEALKKEVENMKELLRKAKIYDEQNNEPNCEKDEKIEMVRKIAEAVGISLDDILKK